MAGFFLCLWSDPVFVGGRFFCGGFCCFSLLRVDEDSYKEAEDQPNRELPEEQADEGADDGSEDDPLSALVGGVTGLKFSSHPEC